MILQETNILMQNLLYVDERLFFFLNLEKTCLSNIAETLF